MSDVFSNTEVAENKVRFSRLSYFFASLGSSLLILVITSGLHNFFFLKMCVAIKYLNAHILYLSDSIQK